MQYWPSEGTMSFGDITMELKKEEECESYTVRDLLVTNTRVRTSEVTKYPTMTRSFYRPGVCNLSIPAVGELQDSNYHRHDSPQLECHGCLGLAWTF